MRKLYIVNNVQDTLLEMHDDRASLLPYHIKFVYIQYDTVQ